MLLELSKLIDCPGASLPFQASVDLGDLQYGSCFPVSEPVRISGTVRNTAGVLLMSGRIDTTIHGVCDRCAADFSAPVSMPVEAVLVSELSGEQDEDEEHFSLVGDSADVDEIVRTVFVLNMGSKLLCKPDCKGLCCRCGKDLNEGPCRCGKEPDPRFAALQQLFEV